MSVIASALLEKITSRRARTGVVGLGYVGLPLAVELGKAGFHATGIDLDTRKVAAIEEGRSYIPDVSTADVKSLRDSGKLDATTDFSVVAELDTINICVPTPLRKTKDPDMSYIVAAVESIAKHLHPGLLVCLESTTYPGTTDEVVQPAARGDRTQGRPRFLPRLLARARRPRQPDLPDPQRAQGRRRPDAGVHGARERALRVGDRDDRPGQLDPRRRDGEAAREHLPRRQHRPRERAGADVRPHGIDVWEVIDAAKTKPFGFMAFYPGPGLGGHCIPIDPFYLSWKAKQSGFDPRFIELAGHINGEMPHYVVDKIAEALNTKRKAINGSKVLIAGVAYKRDIDDMRESPALDVMGLLHARGAQVSYIDPHVPEVHGREWSGRFDIKAVNAGRGSFGQYDCIVIVTDHTSFDYDAMVAESDLIVDTRNAIKRPARNVFKLGAPRPEAEAVAAVSGTIPPTA